MGNFCRNQVITNGKYATILDFYEMHSHNHRLVSLVGCAPVSLSNRKGRAQLNPGRTPNQSLKKNLVIATIHALVSFQMIASLGFVMKLLALSPSAFLVNSKGT